MAAEKKEISVRALISMRECDLTLPFFDLSLKQEYDANKRDKFVKDIIPVIVAGLKNDYSQTKMEQVIKGFFDSHYEESFFNFKAQYEAGRAKDMLKITRMVHYLYANGYMVVDGRTEYQISLNREYRGRRISNITGYADMILLSPGGKHIAVRIKQGEPQYSYSAVKKTNKVENSIELNCLYQGLSKQYGDDLGTALFYLKNKDDKGSALIETFEHKKGKNVISFSFDSLEYAHEKLEYAVSLKVEPCCKDCHYRSLCKTPRFISSETEKKDVPATEQTDSPKPVYTPEQQAVVKHLDGSMCVIAVPGAGKTFSLVARLEHLIKDIGIDSSSILFVTFTQKAAAEIKERVSKSLGAGANQPDVFTFNALGYSILREHPEASGGAFRLAGKVDRYRLLEDALSRVPKIQKVSYDGLLGEYGLLALLDSDFGYIDKNGKDSYRIRLGANKDADGIIAVYDEYCNLYKKEGFISYDDQIALANAFLESHPAVLKTYQDKYKYVMVDEYQDVSKAQVDLIYHIAAHGNLVVVGDDDQSIYSFRGGSSQYMLSFHKDWPNSKRITMEDNFRSVSTVLEAANPIISTNPERFIKKIRPHIFTSNRPVFYNDLVAKDLWNLLSGVLKQGYNPGDIAVIARKNAELEVIENELLPHVDVLPSRQYLIEDAVFLTLYDIFTMYYQEVTDYSLYRFLKMRQSADGIPSAGKGTMSLYDSLCKTGAMLPLDYKDIACLPEYERRKEESAIYNSGHLLISAFKAIQYAKSVTEAIGEIFRLLFNEKNHIVLNSLCTLADERLMGSVYELFSYMKAMLRYRDETELDYPKRKKAINLLTAHKAKGKEYPVVIVYNVETYKDDTENRRLLYVAMTRAKEMLYLTNGPIVRGELVKYFIGLVDSFPQKAG